MHTGSTPRLALKATASRPRLRASPLGTLSDNPGHPASRRPSLFLTAAQSPRAPGQHVSPKCSASWNTVKPRSTRGSSRQLKLGSTPQRSAEDHVGSHQGFSQNRLPEASTDFPWTEVEPLLNTMGNNPGMHGTTLRRENPAPASQLTALPRAVEKVTRIAGVLLYTRGEWRRVPGTKAPLKSAPPPAVTTTAQVTGPQRKLGVLG